MSKQKKTQLSNRSFKLGKPKLAYFSDTVCTLFACYWAPLLQVLDTCSFIVSADHMYMQFIKDWALRMWTSKSSLCWSVLWFFLVYACYSLKVISVPLLVQANTELTVLPLTSTGKVWKVNLNCKQCRILGITVNGQHVANYSYADATLRITPLESKKCVCVLCVCLCVCMCVCICVCV